MDVLSITPPRLNPQDVAGSFQKISDYLQNLTELIDYSLGQYSSQLDTVDASGVQTALNEFKATIVTIQRDITDLDSSIGNLSSKLNTLSSDVGANKSNISALTTKLSALEERVSKLEGGN